MNGASLPAKPDLITKLVGAIVVLALGILNFLSLRESSATNTGNVKVLERITRVETQVEQLREDVRELRAEKNGKDGPR